MDDYNTEKSRLRNTQASEMRALEKELKKKKPGPQKEEVSERISETLERHQIELQELANGFGVVLKQPKVVDTAAAVPEPTQVFSDCNWSSLGRSQLEEECRRRGLSKKGNKEDLVSRLVVFSVDQQSKETSTSAVPPHTESADEDGDDSDAQVEKELQRKPAAAGGGGGVQDMQIPTIQYNSSGGRGGRGRGRKLNKRGRGRGARGGDESDSEVRRRNQVGGKWQAASRRKPCSEEDSDDNDVVEDAEQHDSTTAARNGSGADEPTAAAAVSAESAVVVDEEERERQMKRNRVMAQVLRKVMDRNPNGIKLSELPNALQALKVTNFRPELLGFDSVAAWLSTLPHDVVRFCAAKEFLFPPGAGSSSSGDDGDDSN